MKKNLVLLLAGFVIAVFSLGCAKEQVVSDDKVVAAPAAAPDINYLKAVNFDFGKDAISTKDAAILKENAGFLNQYPTVNIVIEGHCDSRGTEAANLALGQRRAERVKNYYINQLKIDSKRITTVSYGKDRPVDTAENESAWAKNRRAETKVVK
ncbi:MAG: OmpA family protein [Elusimicrobiota bacterium]|nr:OmpA family protein [Elusimicrobiota bacterium]